MANLVRAISLLLVLAMAGCGQSATRGLVLPEGDAARGQDLFVSQQCIACHTIRGLDLPTPDSDPEYAVALGGRGPIAYPDLVTSIINPSHRVARRFRTDAAEGDDSSPMRVYNDLLTVTDLIDLVTFLESQYKVEPIARYRYVPYSYPD